MAILGAVITAMQGSAETETEKMLEQGCTIVGTDFTGTPTNFLCPEGVK